ncbi:hypothetical protein [uncultured Arthrobacter sp.]|uniref:hypothetical protein n=1 Tax=uncultured Arthrobacter sp. TaxID=114050 RepID=UPI002618975A|nr:hypothetical protein [uncultured Arthrobacter sp.]
MTKNSQLDGRDSSAVSNRWIRFLGTVIAIGVFTAVAVHLVWRNFGRDDFARTPELGSLFLYWWAFGAIIGVIAFIFALKSTRPTPLLDFIGVFALASTIGVAFAASDFSAERLGPATLTVPLLFPLAQFLVLRLTKRAAEPAAWNLNTPSGGKR